MDPETRSHVQFAAVLAFIASSVLMLSGFFLQSWLVAGIGFFFWIVAYVLLLISPNGTSRQKWLPLMEDRDADAFKMLCSQCRSIAARSELIMGSDRLMIALEEWHTVLCIEDMRKNVEDLASPCHLCTLLWHSVSEEGHKRIKEAKSNVTHNNPGFDVVGTAREVTPLIGRCHPPTLLRLKVWEEYPLSAWTFAQMYLANKAVGARLLIARACDRSLPQISRACSALTTGSDAHLKQAKEWLEKCLQCHDGCRAAHTSNSLPKRMIHISCADFSTSTQLVPKLELQSFEKFDPKISYAAFSHCWGSNNTTKTLTLQNQHALAQSIPYQRLSKNVQDAIRVCQLLGIEYMWIDSLCIIQNSKDDWADQAAKMGDVYAGALLTIASTGSASGDGGCFHERNLLNLTPCKLGSAPKHLSDDCSQAIYIRHDDNFDFQRHVDGAPLNRRAWAFQERLLSRRILHFGKNQMYWECLQRSACELTPHGYKYKKFSDFRDQTLVRELHTEDHASPWNAIMLRREDRIVPLPSTVDPDVNTGLHPSRIRKQDDWRGVRHPSYDTWTKDPVVTQGPGFRAAFNSLKLDEFSDKLVGLSSFTNCWYRIVEDYTRGRLTFSSDKLIAIAGIVDQIQQSTKFNFIAGLWKEHMLTDMLWFAAEGPGCRLLTSHEQSDGQVIGVAESGLYIAPSWSWASIEGVVGVDLLPDKPEWLLEVRRVLATILDTRLMGSTLRIRAPLCHVEKLDLTEGACYLKIKGSHLRAARFFPDVAIDTIRLSRLFCLSCLELDRRTAFDTMREIQGVVLRELWNRLEGSERTFERVGFFTTSRSDTVMVSLYAFSSGPRETVAIM